MDLLSSTIQKRVYNQFPLQSMKTLLLLLLIMLLRGITAIGIVLYPSYQRCMLSAIKNPEEILYINLFFPAIPSKQIGQLYIMTIENQLTEQRREIEIQEGHFTDQLHTNNEVDDGSIYEICFRVKTRRNFGRILFSYSTEYLTAKKTSALSQFPSDLLKDQHLKGISLEIKEIEDGVKLFKRRAEGRSERMKKKEEEILQQTAQSLMINSLQIIVIVVMGAYQFLRIRSIIMGNI